MRNICILSALVWVTFTLIFRILLFESLSLWPAHMWVVYPCLWFKRRNSAVKSYFLFCPFSPPLFYIHLLVLAKSSQAFQPNTNIKWRFAGNFKAKPSNSPEGREGSRWLCTGAVGRHSPWEGEREVWAKNERPGQWCCLIWVVGHGREVIEADRLYS